MTILYVRIITWYSELKQDICHGDGMKDVTTRDQIEHHMGTTALGEIFESSVSDFCRLFAYDAGEQICREGEEIHHLLFLVEGKAKPFGMLANGRAYMFRIEEPLSVYGDLEVLEDRQYRDNVEAVTACLCLAVPMAYIRRYCLDSPVFLKYIISTLAERLRMISRNSTESLLMPLRNKLAVYLLNESADGMTVTVRSTYLELAESLGTTYRHLSRVMKDMTERGLIEKKGKVIRLLDTATLIDLAGDSLR